MRSPGRGAAPVQNERGLGLAFLKEDEVIEALRKSMGIKAVAARALGVTRQDLIYWAKKPAVAKALAEIEEENLDKVEAKLIKKIEQDDLGAIIFYLKCKGRSRGYAPRLLEMPLPPLVEDTSANAARLARLSVDQLEQLEGWLLDTTVPNDNSKTIDAIAIGSSDASG